MNIHHIPLVERRTGGRLVLTDCHHTWIAGNTCDNNDNNDNDYDGIINNYIGHGMIVIFWVVLDRCAQ